MKGRIVSIAAELAVLRQPAVDPPLAVGEYIAALSRYAVTPKENVSVRLLARWAQAETQAPNTGKMEEVLAEFSRSMAAGRLVGRRGRYRYMVRQAPSDIFTLHNRAVKGTAPGFQRPLVPHKTCLRLWRIARLTDQTQLALAWFLEKGTRPASKGRAAKPLTAKSRSSAVYAALQLLDLMKLRGLEEVKAELLPELSPDDRRFKTTSRILHTASAVYRACVGRGLLPANPLVDVNHSIFDTGAERDFVGPDGMAALRDLSTVDMNDARQVTDRLVCLLYADSAMRRDELAGVALSDLREHDGGYQVTLRAEAQKMQNKATAILPLLYPETNRLLSVYLKNIRGSRPGALIANTQSGDATGEWLAKAVKRECERLGILTYYRKTPSPHCLRRGFATCNCKPLGMGMDINEVATRLRIDIRVAHRHYVQENPLLSEMKTRVYRQLAAPDPQAEADGCIATLARLGYPAAMLKPLRLELERRRVALEVDPAPTAVWVDEHEVLTRLQHQWQTRPNPRKLRAAFAKMGCTDRGLARGRIRYRLDAVEKLLAEYAATHLFSGLVQQAQFRAALQDFVTLRIGGITLLRHADVAAFVQRLKILKRGRPHESGDVASAGGQP